MKLFPRLADERDKSRTLEECAVETASMFIPADRAAICADAECGGVFMVSARTCPGCGSKHFVLLNGASWMARAMREAK